MTAAPVRVLVIDDSAMIRRVLTMGLSEDPGIEVIGAASGAEQAWEMIRRDRPDVITLDVEMPGVDGLTFLRRLLPEIPVPAVVISALTQESAGETVRAMQAGAVDVIAKPALRMVGEGLPTIMEEIRRRVRAAVKARPSVTRPGAAPRLRRPGPAAPSIPNAAGRLFAIGASTGGVQALSDLLPRFPADAPATVVVQHMPEGFTAAFAARLNTMCEVEVREAAHGDRVTQGVVLIAPGGRKHLGLERDARGLKVVLFEGEPVCFSRPSVDVMFESAARHGARRCTAALLTGMGRDGAAGMLTIRRAGGRTISQDEATSVVYGMPQAAAALGAAERILPLEEIAQAMLDPGSGADPAPPAPAHALTAPDE